MQVYLADTVSREPVIEDEVKVPLQGRICGAAGDGQDHRTAAALASFFPRCLLLLLSTVPLQFASVAKLNRDPSIQPDDPDPTLIATPTQPIKSIRSSDQPYSLMQPNPHQISTRLYRGENKNRGEIRSTNNQVEVGLAGNNRTVTCARHAGCPHGSWSWAMHEASFVCGRIVRVGWYPAVWQTKERRTGQLAQRELARARVLLRTERSSAGKGEICSCGFKSSTQHWCSHFSEFIPDPCSSSIYSRNNWIHECFRRP